MPINTIALVILLIWAWRDARWILRQLMGRSRVFSISLKHIYGNFASLLDSTSNVGEHERRGDDFPTKTIVPMMRGFTWDWGCPSVRPRVRAQENLVRWNQKVV